MVKTTWSRFDELAKAYVSREYEHGYCGHLRFSGAVARSYGVAVGLLLDAPGGEKIGLVSRHRYSKSTARQLGEVATAMRAAGYRILEVGLSHEAIDFAETGKHRTAFLKDFRRDNDDTINRLIAEIDERKNPSYALANVYWAIARLIRDRELICGAYGQVWPSPGSADEAQIRGDAIAQAVRDKDDPSARARDEKAVALSARLSAERKLRPPAAFEIALQEWRTGERLLLEDNRHPVHLSYCRYRDRHFELSHRFGLKIKPSEFSKLLAEIAAVREGGWLSPHRLGSGHVEVRTYGLVTDHRTVGLAELLAAARIGMPRLHRRYAAAFAVDDADVDHEIAGPAP